MTHHDLHTLADRIAREERLTHSEALARRPRHSLRGRSRTTVKPRAFAHVEKPNARPFWWQRDDL